MEGTPEPEGETDSYPSLSLGMGGAVGRPHFPEFEVGRRSFTQRPGSKLVSCLLQAIKPRAATFEEVAR